MYNEFKISAFRGLTNLRVESMALINLFAGPNSVGKTALLEAIWMHNAPNVPDTALRVNRFRGLLQIDPNKLLWELFPDLNAEVRLMLSANGDWGPKSRILEIHVADRDTIDTPIMRDGEQERMGGGESDSRASRQEIVYEYTDENGATLTSRAYYVASLVQPGMIEEGLRSERQTMERRSVGVFMATRNRSGPQEEVRRLSNILASKRHDEIVAILRCIDPQIEGLSILTSDNQPTIYADLGGAQMLPASLFGDGALRLMSIALAIMDSANGIVLIDEIENGVYYNAMEAVWNAIGDAAAKYNVQIFSTTHSNECLVAAHRAFSKMANYNFRFHRLERVNGETRCFTFDKESLETAIQSGLETR